MWSIIPWIWRTALVHSKEVWLQPIITVCPQYNKCTGIKSVNNSILLNRLHTAMITVLNTSSNLLFGVNRWKGARPLWGTYLVWNIRISCRICEVEMILIYLVAAAWNWLGNKNYRERSTLKWSYKAINSESYRIWIEHENHFKVYKNTKLLTLVHRIESPEILCAKLVFCQFCKTRTNYTRSH